MDECGLLHGSIQYEVGDYYFPVKLTACLCLMVLDVSLQ